MFVLTHTADVVRNGDSSLGVILFAGLLIIMAISAVLIVKNVHK